MQQVITYVFINLSFLLFSVNNDVDVYIGRIHIYMLKKNVTPITLTTPVSYIKTYTYTTPLITLTTPLYIYISIAIATAIVYAIACSTQVLHTSTLPLLKVVFPLS